MWRTLLIGSTLSACFALPSPAHQIATSKNAEATNNANPSASASGPTAAVPSPKYLIEIYSPSKPAGNQEPNKPKRASEAAAGSEQQTISFDDISEHKVYDGPFEVTAKSDSNLPVTITLKSGPATVSGSTATIDGPGAVTLVASQPGNSTWQRAKDVEKTFENAEDDDYCVPGLIPKPEPTKKSMKPDAATIIAWLGNPVPFSFEALGKGQIAIYSSIPKSRLSSKQEEDRKEIERRIDDLAKQPDLEPPTGSAGPSSTPSNSSPSAKTPGAAPAKPGFSLEVAVPHARAMGNLATKLSSLSSATFQAQPVGTDKILITSPKAPSCHEATAYLKDIRRLAWQPSSESPVAQEYHLQSPSDLVSAFGSGSNPPSSPSPSGEHPTSSSPSPPSTSGTSPTSSSSSKPGSSGNANAPSGSGNPGTSGNTGSPEQPAASQPAPQKPVALIEPDLFLFQSPTPGDDADIAEKKRILAQLDLPRPVVLINTWSIQASTTRPKELGQFSTVVKRVVAQYNEGLQQVVQRGWGSLSGQMAKPSDYFAPDFYRYVTGRYVADLPVDSRAQANRLSDRVAADVLQMRSSNKLPEDYRKTHGICDVNQYCLGYKNIFLPVQPRLTDLLLAIIAANKPWTAACSAIAVVEGKGPDVVCNPPTEAAIGDCETLDRDALVSQKSEEPRVHLGCFREAAYPSLEPADNPPASGGPNGASMVRAAVADFLFNFKMAQQYPHEFSPYLLTLSAQKLDTALGPFVDAFNRDIIAYQRFLRDRIDACAGHIRAKDECHSDWGKDWIGFKKSTFVNNAIVSVRTLSATPTSVSVTTQNFLSDTQAPTLSGFLATTLGSASGGSKASGSASAATTVADLLQKASPLPAQLLLNALNSAQYSEVQIGKSLSLKVTPHGLSGASSAEIDVTMNADDAADPTFYTPAKGSGSKADVSRVSKHDVTTRVRLDSLGLFDISSFSAELQRSRSRFPILPVPGLEVPYIGSLVGIPLPSAKEYHSSTAVMSAIVVPTASDLAFGLTFERDYVVDANHADTCHWPGSGDEQKPLCALRPAKSLADLDDAPIRFFNTLKVACLAAGAAYPGIGGTETNPPQPASCKDLRLDTVPRNVNPAD
jgi:hypothetical protein